MVALTEEQVYKVVLLASTAIGASYNVIVNHKDSTNFNQIVTNAISGAITGVSVGLFSPLVAGSLVCAVPGLLYNKIFKRRAPDPEGFNI